MTRTTDFNREKARLLHLAGLLQRAQSAAELRALLMADTSGPWHSFDGLSIAAAIENMGSVMAELLYADMDAQEVNP